MKCTCRHIRALYTRSEEPDEENIAICEKHPSRICGIGDETRKWSSLNCWCWDMVVIPNRNPLHVKNSLGKHAPFLLVT